LGKYYAEAAPKPNQSRAKQMAAEQANEYTKNSFKSIRSQLTVIFRTWVGTYTFSVAKNSVNSLPCSVSFAYF
jgi:hypothetical protein